MSIDRLIGNWSEVRAGLIKEVSQIPEDQFSFRATPETRSVAELLQHVVQSQKMLVGESCRADTNLMRTIVRGSHQGICSRRGLSQRQEWTARDVA
jgi:hypothetical protein